MNSKKTVLSGIRATGRLHLGNYLGAVKGMLDLQNDSSFETYFMVADLHSVTTPYSTIELEDNVISVVLDYLSCGLDPEKSTIFVQSCVDPHLKIAYYLSTFTTVARMMHLPTYKEKVKQHPESSSVALLNYPILMAADILAYKATHVPVGLDQEPHLEVAREIARKINSTHGTNFPEPVTYKTKGEYVPSLLGQGKMSKSIEGSSILLSDDIELLKSKLSKVPTDSGKGNLIAENSGLYTLLYLVEYFQGVEKRKQYEYDYITTGIKYSELKKDLSIAISDYLQPIQEKRKFLQRDMRKLKEVVTFMNAKAINRSSEVYLELQEKLGFNYKFLH